MRIILEDLPKDEISIKDVDPCTQYIIGICSSNDEVSFKDVFIVDIEGYVYNLTCGLECITDNYKDFFDRDGIYNIDEAYAFEERDDYIKKLIELLGKASKSYNTTKVISYGVKD